MAVQKVSLHCNQLHRGEGGLIGGEAVCGSVESRRRGIDNIPIIYLWLGVVSEPDSRKIGKEGLAHQLGWKCTLRNVKNFINC